LKESGHFPYHPKTPSHLHTSTLFRARMINLALIIACGAIGVLFMISMVCELAQEQALSK
jgi:hypothetical protein